MGQVSLKYGHENEGHVKGSVFASDSMSCKYCQRPVKGNHDYFMYSQRYEDYSNGDAVCDVCFRKHEYDRVHHRTAECANCHNEFALDRQHGDEWAIAHGGLGNFCPRCAEVFKHDNIVSSSKSFRGKLESNKKNIEVIKKRKASPKSRFQSIADDRKRVIQLIKNR